MGHRSLHRSESFLSSNPRQNERKKLAPKNCSIKRTTSAPNNEASIWTYAPVDDSVTPALIHASTNTTPPASSTATSFIRSVIRRNGCIHRCCTTATTTTTLVYLLVTMNFLHQLNYACGTSTTVVNGNSDAGGSFRTAINSGDSRTVIATVTPEFGYHSDDGGVIVQVDNLDEQLSQRFERSEVTPFRNSAVMMSRNRTEVDGGQIPLDGGGVETNLLNGVGMLSGDSSFQDHKVKIKNDVDKNDRDEKKDGEELEKEEEDEDEDDEGYRLNDFSDTNDLDKLQLLVMQGLGLSRLPNVSETNISHTEYITKYRMYLDRLHDRQMREAATTDDFINPKRLVTFTNSTTDFRHRRKRALHTTNTNDLVYIHFTLSPDDIPSIIEESTLRFMIKSHHGGHTATNTSTPTTTTTTTTTNSLQLNVYQLTEMQGRVLISQRHLPNDELQALTTNTNNNKWLEFDVTPAMERWRNGDKNLGLEISCTSCDRHHLHIVHDMSPYATEQPDHNPALNVIGQYNQHTNAEHHRRNKRGIHRVVEHEVAHPRHYHHFEAVEASASSSSAEVGGGSRARKARKAACNHHNPKCCRHTMDVIFKELRGFEFILQPKNFDAGYCRGKCPPRYNPASHHALLQSLVWKQHRTVPKPCCAPSKLVELEVLHVDESNPNKLKVTTWSNMRVLECACS